MESEQCVFCEILAGRQEGSFVYRADLIAAFLTIGPINPGHILIVPLRHAPSVADMTAAEAEAMFSVGRAVGAALRQSPLKCEGINYWLADGEAAFQDVFHVHLHVFPRFAGDSFKLTFDAEKPSREELEGIAKMIRLGLN